MINDFIHAAMPWVMMGLALALFFVAAFRRKVADTLLTPDERVLHQKKQNERMATAMALGMLFGIALGCTPWLDLPSGVSCGALMGVAAGYLLLRHSAPVPVVDTLLFDLGGVLIDTDEQYSYDRLKALGCVVPDTPEDIEAAARMGKALIDGSITLPEYVDFLRRYLPSEVPAEEVASAVLDSLRGLPPARLERLRQLKMRYHVVLLSNIGPEVWQYAVGQLRAVGTTPEELFDQVFLSYEMRLAKPDPEIYRRVLAESGIVASRTLYFDDRQENVDAGAAAGLRAVKVAENHIEDLVVYQSL